MRRAAVILAAAVMMAGAAHGRNQTGTGGSAPSDSRHFDAIRKLAQEQNYSAARKESAAFLKNHPESRLVPDVRLILADIETAPGESIALYRTIVTNYGHYAKRPYAQYRICEIAYLQSKWDILEREAREGLRLGTTPYGGKFSYFLIIALIQAGDYAGAEKECRRLIDTDHDYRTMARSLLLLAHIIRSTSGFSREYIGTIRDIAAGYADSDAIQSALYLLGDFYENRRLYNEAYSAYTDLVTKYPGSPEAAEASHRISALMKHHPRRVLYLPGKKILDTAGNIDIHPETDMPEENGSSAFYSISVGPLASARQAAELKALLKDFNFIKTVRLKSGYALHVGRGNDEESALKLKVRLAEEYGINGRIVRISGDGERSYIYGE